MINKKPLFLLLSLGALVIFAVFFGWEEVGKQLSRANPATMGLLFLLQLATLALTTFQWKFMLIKSGSSVSAGKIFSVILAGNYVESITPAAKLGGESAKVYLFHRLTALPGRQLAGIILALKYYSLLPFLALAALSFGLGSWRYQLPPAVPGAFIFLVLFFGAVWWLHKKAGTTKSPSARNDRTRRDEKPGRTVNLVCSKYHAVGSFIREASVSSRSQVNYLEQLGLIFISALIWSLYPVKIFIVCRMLSLETDLATVTMITFTAYMISMVPLLPGGLGSFEGSMALLFSLAGILPVYGLSVALLSRLATYWFPLLLSVPVAVFIAGDLVKGLPPAGSTNETGRSSQGFLVKQQFTEGE